MVLSSVIDNGQAVSFLRNQNTQFPTCCSPLASLQACRLASQKNHCVLVVCTRARAPRQGNHLTCITRVGGDGEGSEATLRHCNKHHRHHRHAIGTTLRCHRRQNDTTDAQNGPPSFPSRRGVTGGDGSSSRNACHPRPPHRHRPSPSSIPSQRQGLEPPQLPKSSPSSDPGSSVCGTHCAPAAEGPAGAVARSWVLLLC